MADLEYTRSLEDEYGRGLRWKQAICLLSLDATSQFRRELGLDCFDLEVLREIARCLIDETGMAWDYDVHPPGLAAEYLRRVAARLGEDTCPALRDWFDATFPYQPGVASPDQIVRWHCPGVWRGAWETLVKGWDSADDSTPLPPCNPAYTRYRLDIRRLVAELNVVYGEIEMLEDFSDWDSQFETRVMEDWVTSTLWAVMADRIVNTRLPALLRGFPAEEVAAFSTWWRIHGWPEECLAMLQQPA